MPWFVGRVGFQGVWASAVAVVDGFVRPGEHNGVGRSRRPQQRGGNRLRARGAGAKDTLTASDRILATVLHQRKTGTHDLLTALLGVTRSTMSRAVQEVQPLLAEHGHPIPPSTARLRTPADLAAFLTLEAAQRKTKVVNRELSRAAPRWPKSAGAARGIGPGH
jgi:hypothetical protein